MNVLLPLGRFSQASRLSVRMLQQYDDDGLLSPERTGEEPEQWQYAPAQLADARVIRALRDLDVPVDRIRQVLAERDIAVLRRVVVDHSVRAAAEMTRRESIVVELDALLSARESPRETVVRLRDLPTQQVVSTRARTTLRGLPVMFAASVGRLDRVLRDAPGQRTGPATVFHHGEEFDPQNVDVEVAVPVQGTVPASRGIVVRDVPATLAAVTVHVGPYDSLDEGYRAVAEWVCANGYHMGNDPRETYLFGSEQTGPEQFRTEIAWPLINL